MKYLNRLSFSSLILFLIIFATAFANPSSSAEIPFKNGILDGDVSVSLNQEINNVSGRSIEGAFKNNQKVGSWKLWDKNHKLLQERIYKNNFEYSLIKNGKEVENKYPLKRNEKGIYPFPKLEEEDIIFAQRLWKIIPMEYLATNSSLDYEIKNIDFTSFQAYTDDNLSKKDSTNQISKLDFTDLSALRIMGDWYYDTKRNISVFQIIAISPVIEQDDRSFWFYYPDMRLSTAKIEAESSLSLVHSLDDIMFFGDYPSLIYKVENIEDTPFQNDVLKDSTISNIEYRLMVEAAYWAK